MSAKCATKLAAATTTATTKITATEITVGTLDARWAIARPLRAGSGGPLGGVSPGAGAQGTKDGPLGVGPMPVLSEPLGSSISTTVAQDCPAAETADPTGCPQERPTSSIAIHRFADCRRIRLPVRNLTT